MTTQKNHRVAILCEAAPESGMGHLVRCSALCRALRRAGADVVFLLLRGGRTDWADLPGVEVRVMESDPNNGPKTAQEFLSRLPDDTLLAVADSYRLGSDFFEALHQARPELAVIAHDDFGEKARFPLLGVINAGLGSREIRYPGRFSLFSAVGPEYAALGRQWLDVPPRDPADAPVKRILLVMGGSDPEQQTLRLARILDAMNLDASVEVVLGPLYGNKEPGYDALGPGFTVHEAPDDFPALAAECDFAITGSGGTCMELLYLGVPVAALCLADNQAPTLRAIQDQDLGIVLGRFDEISDADIELALRQALVSPKHLVERAARGRRLVDGRGADRLAKRVLNAALLYSGRGFGPEEVAQEYRTASHNKEHHEMGLWGSAEGMRNRFLLALEWLGKDDVASWLDVGCGPGDFFAEARETLAPRRFTGLDACTRTLDIARQRTADLPWCRYAGQDFMDPVEGEPFSLVTALGVLHKSGHSLDDSVGRLAGLVEPGGRLLLTTKNLGWKNFDDPDFRPYAGHAWFHPGQVEAAMARHGLEGVSIRGFEPRSGRWEDLDRAHSMMILATREGTQ